jgi:hypothetical protein
MTATSTMTVDQARNLRFCHDTQVRTLSRMSRAALKNLLDVRDRAAGFTRSGGPSSKDELVRELVEQDYPLGRLNEAIHVLHHQQGEVWSACEHCHVYKVSYLHSAGYRVSRTFDTRAAAQEFIDNNALVYPLPSVRLEELPR